MNNKRHYDKRHTSLFFGKKEKTLIRLHKEYIISSIFEIIKKLTQQFVDSFKILAKIERLIYKLDISDHWKIHFVFSIAQLELTLSSSSNFYNHSRFVHFEFVYIEKNIDILKSYQLERLLNKRTIKWKGEQFIEYRIR